MIINSQKELDELIQKYVGKTATDKINGDKFEINFIGINHESTHKGIEQLAVVNLVPIDVNSEDRFERPPALNYVLDQYHISD